MAAVSPVPDGFNTVTPHLVIHGVSDAITFYREAFGAEETVRLPGPGGKLLYAEIRIGNSRVMLTDEMPGGAKGPRGAVDVPVTVHLYVEDADEVFRRAVAAGARVTMPMQDRFWGDRYGKIEDPFGHSWSIASRVENLTPQEMMERAPTMQ